MTEPQAVNLTVSGVLNGAPLAATGTLTVDAGAGTKDGTVVYETTPGAVAPGPDCTVFSTGRCFVGARKLGRTPFVGPLELLGREFVSMRVTRLGRFGTVSISENGSIERTTLRSELTTVGEYRGPRTRAMGPLRETIRVLGNETLSASGRYSLIPSRGRPIPATYVQFYRPLRPNHRLFARLQGTAFLLRAELSTSVRGKTLHYHSRSTIAPVRRP